MCIKKPYCVLLSLRYIYTVYIYSLLFHVIAVRPVPITGAVQLFGKETARLRERVILGLTKIQTTYPPLHDSTLGEASVYRLSAIPIVSFRFRSINQQLLLFHTKLKDTIPWYLV